MAAMCLLKVTKPNPAAYYYDCYKAYKTNPTDIISNSMIMSSNNGSAPCGTNAMSVMAAVCLLKVTKPNPVAYNYDCYKAYKTNPTDIISNSMIMSSNNGSAPCGTNAIGLTRPCAR